jgi:hypothetical protein
MQAILSRLANLPHGCTGARAEDIPATFEQMQELVGQGLVTVRLSHFPHPNKRLEIYSLKRTA